MSISLVVASLLPVFLLIALGWCLRRFAVIESEHWYGIEQLGFWVLFPALLFNALVKADLRSLSLDAVVLTYGSALIVLLLLLLVIYLFREKIFNLDGPAYSTVFQTSSRWNAFIALAIMEKYGGSTGLAMVAIIMAFTIPILNLINIMAVAYTASKDGPGWRRALTKTISNPMIIGALGGILVNLTAIEIYQPVLLGVDLVARAGLGVGLLTIGAGLKLRAVFQARQQVWLGVVNKMVLFPILMLFFGYLFDVSGLTLTTLVLCASIPTAMNGYIVARQMGGDAELYATTAAVQSLLSMATIPLFLWLSTIAVFSS